MKEFVVLDRNFYRNDGYLLKKALLNLMIQSHIAFKELNRL
jgi:hypothetical protein